MTEVAVAERTAERSAPFLDWLDDWFRQLRTVSLRRDILEPAGGPERVGVLVVDLLVGFCSEGRLASPRIGALVPPTVAFLQEAWNAGIRHLLVPRDAHPPDSPEFAAFGPHCIAGTREAELAPELTRLPFADRMISLPKQCLNVGLTEGFRAWREAHPQVRSWIVLGDCTDLCIYQTAMHLRLKANQEGQAGVAVWVPANLVQTYDLPVEAARAVGALPHDGDLMHRLFLYHLALNGVNVVREIEP